MGNKGTSTQLPVYGTKGVEAAANTPGKVTFSSGWTDPVGNLWFFGGTAASTLFYHDIWRFNIKTYNWTWMDGDGLANKLSEYGVESSSTAPIAPGGRYRSEPWIDNTGKLWFFGGSGYAANPIGPLTDIWQYVMPDNTLPIVLNAFNATLQHENVTLDWSTQQEQNSSHFVIERSINGIEFADIGRVNAAGTSNSLRNYQFVDKPFLTGTLYYRIKEVDVDGKLLFSPIRIVYFSKLASSFSVFANPANNKLRLNINSSTAQQCLIQVSEISGRLLFSEKKLVAAGNGLYEINIGNLSSGTYLISVKSGNIFESKKFVRH